MPPPEKRPVPQKEPPDETKPPISDPPPDPNTDPKSIDVDDAQIEEPKDEVFGDKTPDEDNTTNRLKERDRLSKDLEKQTPRRRMWAIAPDYFFSSV